MNKALIYITLVLIGWGCTESFLEPYRQDPSEISGDAFWQDPGNANKVLTSAYANLQRNGLYGRGLHEPLCLMTHEADLDWLNKDEWNQFNTNSVTSRNGQIGGIWTAFYRVIRDANDVIEHEDAIMPSPDFPQQKIDDIIGQAYFLRAFSYMHLSNLFGEAYPATNPSALSVPLVLSVPKTEEEFYLPRSTVEAVYLQMETDLKLAIDLIEKEERNTSDQGRISKMAAIAQLGKIYLFWQKYDKAIEQFEQVINSGHYSLLAKMSNVYDGNHEFNSESILEWNYSALSEGFATAYDGGTYQQFTLIHGPVEQVLFANFHVSKHSLNRFGDDPRLTESVVQIGDKVAVTASGLKLPVRKYPVTRKFFNPEIVEPRDPGMTTNIVIIRLSDVMLMCAEAYNATGNDAKAKDYVNMVRRRAYGKPVNTPDATVDFNLSGTALRDTIREERWKELHYEGHRWYDIQRWRILEEELAKVPQSTSGAVVFDEKDYYWPIPESELKTNPNLEQSELYN
jgi:starch-binding outer membrane protein, SusD/RagB family